MNDFRRFVAGAICPNCKKKDTIALSADDKRIDRGGRPERFYAPEWSVARAESRRDYRRRELFGRRHDGGERRGRIYARLPLSKTRVVRERTRRKKTLRDFGGREHAVARPLRARDRRRGISRCDSSPEFGQNSTKRDEESGGFVLGVFRKRPKNANWFRSIARLQKHPRQSVPRILLHP